MHGERREVGAEPVIVSDVEGTHAALDAVAHVGVPQLPVDLQLALGIAPHADEGLIVPLGGIDGGEAALEAEVEVAPVHLGGDLRQAVGIADRVPEDPEAGRQARSKRQRKVVHLQAHRQGRGPARRRHLEGADILPGRRPRGGNGNRDPEQGRAVGLNREGLLLEQRIRPGLTLDHHAASPAHLRRTRRQAGAARADQVGQACRQRLAVQADDQRREGLPFVAGREHRHRRGRLQGLPPRLVGEVRQRGTLGSLQRAQRQGPRADPLPGPGQALPALRLKLHRRAHHHVVKPGAPGNRLGPQLHGHALGACGRRPGELKGGPGAGQRQRCLPGGDDLASGVDVVDAGVGDHLGVAAVPAPDLVQAARLHSLGHILPPQVVVAGRGQAHPQATVACMRFALLPDRFAFPPALHPERPTRRLPADALLEARIRQPVLVLGRTQRGCQQQPDQHDTASCPVSTHSCDSFASTGKVAHLLRSPPGEQVSSVGGEYSNAQRSTRNAQLSTVETRTVILCPSCFAALSVES